jgi:hypothetical protein
VLGELGVRNCHEGTHIRHARVGGGLGSRVPVGESFLDGSAFLQLTKFGEGAAEDEVRLGSGSVHGFLLLFGPFIVS